MNAGRPRVAAVVLLGAAYFAGCASPEPASEQVVQAKVTPEEAVSRLYGDETFLQVRNELPGDTLHRFDCCFTPELVKHFESHNERVAKWMAQHKDDNRKLPMSEGPIFVSNYEGADTYSVGPAQVEGSTAEVPVSLSYTEGPDTVRWVDVAMLRLVNGVWLLDDIRFDPERLDGYTLRKRVALDE